MFTALRWLLGYQRTDRMLFQAAIEARADKVIARHRSKHVEYDGVR